ncbi:MAG: hypothetical protein JKY09_08140 [Crocinitomicaceae bacterium]|nr:hypothetical protein [Crocinitomicaceae bacterium]
MRNKKHPGVMAKTGKRGFLQVKDHTHRMSRAHAKQHILNVPHGHPNQGGLGMFVLNNKKMKRTNRKKEDGTTNHMRITMRRPRRLAGMTKHG